MFFDNIPSLIIESLIKREGVANAKTIHTDVVSDLGKQISIQSIYKNINSLIQKKILVKHINLYTLSLPWLQNIRDISTSIEQKVLFGDFYHDFLLELNDGKKRVLQSKNQMDMIHVIDNLIIAICSHLPPNTKALNYEYHTLMPKKRALHTFIDKSNIKWESYIYGQTKWDYKASKTKDTKFITHYIAKQYIPFKDVIVIGDYIIEMGYNNDYKNFLHKAVLSASKNYKWAPIKDFVYTPVSNQDITIWKNKNYANTLIHTIEQMK